MLNCKGHVLISRSVTSHSVARRLAHLLRVCGTPALLIDAEDNQHGLPGAVPANDGLITFSKDGNSSEIIFLAQVAKLRGVTVVSITEKSDPDLGKIPDIVLRLVAFVEGDPFDMISTGSSLINGAYGDVFAWCL